jgi:hypothetical protein
MTEGSNNTDPKPPTKQEDKASQPTPQDIHDKRKEIYAPDKRVNNDYAPGVGKSRPD